MTDTTSKSQAKKRLAVLISGRGSNMASILKAQQSRQLTAGEVVLVISNKAKAGGLEIAREAGIKTVVIAMKDPATGERKPLERFDAEIVEHLKLHRIDAVVLAGYGRIISNELLNAFPNRIVNIHPSLLPAYGGVGMVGAAVHQAVVAASEAQSGCTVHVVTETVDGGPVLGQATVPVLTSDTAETLAERVLAYEHKLYPAVLQAWLAADFRSDFPESEACQFGLRIQYSDPLSPSVVS